MLRPLYRWVLRLHPAGFRTRFADEMLSIFDHTFPHSTLSIPSDLVPAP